MINLKDSNAFLAAKYYLSQFPAHVSVAGIGMALGLQLLTSAWKAWSVRERMNDQAGSETNGDTCDPPGSNAKRFEVD